MALNVRTEKLRGGCYIPAPGLRGRFSVVRSRRVSGGPGGPYGELRSGHELFASVEQQSRETSRALSVLASWRPFIVSTIYRAGFLRCARSACSNLKISSMDAATCSGVCGCGMTSSRGATRGLFATLDTRGFLGGTGFASS